MLQDKGERPTGFLPHSLADWNVTLTLNSPPATSAAKLNRRPPVSSTPPASLQGGSSNASSADPSASEAESGSPTLTFRTPASQTRTRPGTFSSPSLPSLPVLKNFGVTLANPRSSPPLDPPTDSSLYYTASWGSPYQRHTPDQPRGDSSIPRWHRHSRTVSSDGFLEHSPSLARDFGLSSDGLLPDLPAPTGHRDEETPRKPSRLLPSPSLAKRTRGLAKDRVNHYLLGRSSERRNWWSDDSAEGELKSYTGKRTQGPSREDGDASSDIEEAQESVSPWTVTLKPTFNSVRTQGPRRHKSKRSNETLKQRDFWNPIATETKEHSTTRNMLASRYADTPPPGAEASPVAPPPETATSEDVPSPSPDKPLPPPPFPERRSSIQDTGSTPVSTRSSHKRAPTMSSSKKRVPWRGKNCVISVPTDNHRGKEGFAPVPLTKDDMKLRLKDWEDNGFDIRGFGYWNQRTVVNGSEGEGQSRSVYPDPGELDTERRFGKYTVSIPDRREWEQYVKQLNEERLRALGVDIGGGDAAPSASPAPSAMSRQVSSHFTGPSFSPPLATSSVASNHAQTHVSPFSPPFAGIGSTDPSSRVASVASPVSLNANNQPYAAPMSNAGRDRTFSSPFQMVPQQPTPPVRGVWPPQTNQSPDYSRGGSPAMQGNLQSLGAILSPSIASAGNQIEQKVPEGYFNQLSQAKSVSPAPAANETKPRPDDTDHNLERSQEGVSTPANDPSAGDHHLEESIPREFANSPASDPTSPFDTGDMQLDQTSLTDLLGDKVPSFSLPEEPEPESSPTDDVDQLPQEAVRSSTFHHPQPHLKTHSLSQSRLGSRMDPFSDEIVPEENGESDLKLLEAKFGDGNRATSADVETNPSASNTPGLGFQNGRNMHSHQSSTASNPYSGMESHSVSQSGSRQFGGHTAKSSMSKLNVAAKEFQFDPSSSFTPGNFSFSSNSFEPAVPSFGGFGNHSAPHQGHSNRISSVSSRGGGGLNVAAAAFEPSKPAKSAFPTGDFSFSSAGPSFRPSAPEFTPGTAVEPTPNTTTAATNDKPASVPSVPEVAAESKDKIFDMSGFIKPPKKSRAIPIVRPDDNVRNTSSNDDDAHEDESGRITQGDGRLKRARRFDSQTVEDGPPLINAPFAESKINQLPAAASPSAKAASPGKENSQPENEVTRRSASNESQQSTTAANNDKIRSPPDYDGSGWPPFEFAGAKEAEQFNAARPLSPPRKVDSVDKATILGDESEDDMDELSVQQAELAIEAEEIASRIPSREAASRHQEQSNRKPDFEVGPNGFQFDFDAGSARAPPATEKKNTLRDSMFAESEPSELGEEPIAPVKKQTTPISIPRGKPTTHAPITRTSSFSEEEQIERGSSVVRTGGVATDSSPQETSASRIRKGGPAWSPDQLSIQEAALDQSSPLHLVRPDFKLRSDAPSPSPRRTQKAYQQLPYEVPHLDTTSQLHGSSEPERAGVAYDSPIHRLNSPGQRPISDWDDMLSSSDEYKFHARSRAFDGHMNSLVGGFLEDRLGPLERTMKTIEASMAAIATDRASSRRRYRSVSAGIVHSDADDEDDDSALQSRPRSPRKDIKLDRLRAVIFEALASQQPERALPAPQNLVEVHQALGELQSSFEQLRQPPRQNDDLKQMFEALLNERLPEQKAVASASEAEIEEIKSRNVSLEQMLQKANSRIEQEITNRRDAEENLFETQKQLRALREEEDRQRGLTAENDQRLKAFDNDMQQDLIQAQMQTAFLEGVRENLQKSTSELSGRNAELESSVMEATMTNNRRKEEIEKLTEETKEQRKLLDSLRVQMEESVHVRESLRGKFSSLQTDMAATSHHMTREREIWRKSDEEHNVRHEVMKARLEAEARTRERLERELERLEIQEREGMKMRVQVEQAESANANLENLLSTVRLESIENQQRAAKFEQEFKEAREAGRIEVQRARILFDADIEAANNQVNVVRADLESENGRIRADFDHFKMEADTSKAQAELVLEEAYDSKMKALREAAEDRERVLNEQESRFERQSDDSRFQHDRSLQNALEDKQRSETHMLERLSLSDAKVEHLQDRNAHLEERLEIAKSAAHAAAQAARSAKGATAPAIPASISRGSEIPEKVSPQALRESILVLQEQLQEREGRIEKLEQELGDVDRDAPNKIKARETEIGWLRELLGVRISDLEDIIQTLSQPVYDREAVKDAAIRLKANLDMEQQEKERTTIGGQSFPSLATISSYASPKAVLPLAAAWGNWRKGREGAQSAFAEFAAGRTQTPSKSSPSGQSFLSGLMTPPSTNLRQTPHGSGVPPQSQSRTRSDRPRQPSSSNLSRRTEKQPMQRPPTTPPLLRQSSYDQDADESADFSTSGFIDDDESTVDGSTIATNKPGYSHEEPFGPGIRM
ncbi:MAG: hypothetical protein M4579_002615 [Chaenotheca gracillima]|nr:MAG: hypothetical protein M4579_002615 [Chaenotheca gracillima]